MLEIRIANYTLIVAMLLVMSTFYLSLKSLNNTNNLTQYQPTLANIQYNLIYK